MFVFKRNLPRAALSGNPPPTRVEIWLLKRRGEIGFHFLRPVFNKRAQARLPFSPHPQADIDPERAALGYRGELGRLWLAPPAAGLYRGRPTDFLAYLPGTPLALTPSGRAGRKSWYPLIRRLHSPSSRPHRPHGGVSAPEGGARRVRPPAPATTVPSPASPQNPARLSIF